MKHTPGQRALLDLSITLDSLGPDHPDIIQGWIDKIAAELDEQDRLKAINAAPALLEACEVLLADVVDTFRIIGVNPDYSPHSASTRRHRCGKGGSMNAREALAYLDERLMAHYATPFNGIREANASITAALDERDRLRGTCVSIKRQGNPHTATQDFPQAADFANWAVEQASNALKEVLP